MAAREQKLTKRGVKSLRSENPLADVWVYDTEVQGFAVRMRHGRKSFYFRYKMGGKDHKKILFATTEGSLDEARNRAAEFRRQVLQGQNPKAIEKRRKAAGMTVEDLANETIEDLESLGRSQNHIKACKRHLRDHIKPELGDQLVTEVEPKDVEKLHRSLKDKPRTGNLVRSTLSLMFKRAIREGYVDRDPTLGIVRFEEHARERFLSDEELKRLLAALEEVQDNPSADAVRLLLYTGSRPKELLGATWDQFDLKAGAWTKPSQHTKAKRTHRVELGDDALAVLSRMKQDRDEDDPECEWLFPSTESKSGHLTTIKKYWASLTEDAEIEGARLYDLRKTVATKLLAAGTDLRTVMGITGHTQPTTLLKHYAHGVPGKQREALKGLFS